MINKNSRTCRRVALVIPVYSEVLSDIETARVNISVASFAGEEVVFIGPRSLPRNFYEDRWSAATHVGVADKNFESVRSYSDWLLTPELYKIFCDFEFILICQTDAILVSPIPEKWLEETSWDYVGAPWQPGFRFSWNPLTGEVRRNAWKLTQRKVYVGNGGLSLRRTSTFTAATRWLRLPWGANEDIVISYFGPNLGIRIPPPQVAALIFMEKGAIDWRPGQGLPQVYGYHGLDKQNAALEREILKASG